MAYIGTLAQTPDGQVYAQGDDGLWHPVSSDVFAAYGLSWGDVNQVSTVPGDVGDPEPGPDGGGSSSGGGGGGPAVAGTLAGLPDGSIYIEDGDGVWHLVPDIDLFNALHLIWADINWVSSLPGPIGDNASVPSGQGGGPPVEGTLAGLPDGTVYIEDGAGGWHWIPNAYTFTAMGLLSIDINWVQSLPGPIGQPEPDLTPAPAPTPVPAPPPPSTTVPPPSSSPTKPTNTITSVNTLGNGATLTTYADGRQVEQLPGQSAYVVRSGALNPSEAVPGTVDEPVPKPVGEAIADYLKAGSTPAQAAASVAALAQSQADQGLSDPITQDALTQEAAIVQQTLIVSGDLTQAPDSGEVAPGVGAGDDPPGSSRELEAALPPLQLPASFTITHETSGLPGFCAIDNMAPAGTPVLAPADGALLGIHFIPWNQSERVGGWTCYFVTAHGSFFLTHFGDLDAAGSYVAGQHMGVVATVPDGWWESHIHEGLNPAVTSPSQIEYLGGNAPASSPCAIGTIDKLSGASTPTPAPPTIVTPPTAPPSTSDPGAPGLTEAPAGVQTAWSGLIGEISAGVPSVQSAIQSQADSIMGIFQ